MSWEIFDGRRAGGHEPKRRFVPETAEQKAERLALEEHVFRQRIDAICRGIRVSLAKPEQGDGR